MTTYSDVDAFRHTFGAPSVPDDPIQVTGSSPEFRISDRVEQTGAGWFLGRFLYLFGAGAGTLTSCMESWAFLLDADRAWTPIGFNAYGALLLIDASSHDAPTAAIGVLDPLTVTFFRHPDLDLRALLGEWLPEGRLATFLDTSVYEQFLAVTGRFLGNAEMLGIRKALPLGGDMQLENFTPIDILGYYRATSAPYAEAYRQVASN